jgi:hypothetical protein
MSPLDEQLDVAERLIHEAGFSSVTGIPAILSQAAILLGNVQGAIQAAPPRDAKRALARLQGFRVKLLLFSSALRRSESILHGYAQHAGFSSHEYGPVGVFTGSRDPVFLSVSV